MPRAHSRRHSGSSTGGHCWTLRMDWTWPVCAWEPHSRTCLYSPAWLSLSRRYWKPRYPGYWEQTHLWQSRERRRLRAGSTMKHPAPQAGCRQLPEHPQLRCVPPVLGPGRMQGHGVLTRRSGRGRSPQRCCPSPGQAARGSRHSVPPACPGSSPARRASACCARGPATKRSMASAWLPCLAPQPAAGGGLQGPAPRWGAGGGGTHSAGDGAEGAHPLHVVGVAAAPRLPARVLATLQHKLLPLEATVLEACPPAGGGRGVRPPRHPPPR